MGIARHVRQLGLYDTLRDGGKHDLVREHMRREFLRCKIGFAKHTPLLGIRGDTGIRPLYVDVLSRALNDLEVIEQEKPSSLLGITLTQQDLLAEGHDGWLAGLNAIKGGTDERPMAGKCWKRTLEAGYDTNWYLSICGLARKGQKHSQHTKPTNTRCRWNHICKESTSTTRPTWQNYEQVGTDFRWKWADDLMC